MTTSAHEMGDDSQPLPGTENQPEFQLWDQDFKDAKAEGKLYEPPEDIYEDAEGSEPKSAPKAAKK